MSAKCVHMDTNRFLPIDHSPALDAIERLLSCYARASDRGLPPDTLTALARAIESACHGFALISVCVSEATE